jgi:hypothetical protein
VGHAILEARIRAKTPDERRVINERMRREAYVLVWAQADRAGVSEPLALTRFLLERLYPDLGGSRLEAIIARFAELHGAGRWAGPRRPTQGEPGGAS